MSGRGVQILLLEPWLEAHKFQERNLLRVYHFLIVDPSMMDSHTRYVRRLLSYITLLRGGQRLLTYSLDSRSDKFSHPHSNSYTPKGKLLFEFVVTILIVVLPYRTCPSCRKHRRLSHLCLLKHLVSRKLKDRIHLCVSRIATRLTATVTLVCLFREARTTVRL